MLVFDIISLLQCLQPSVASQMHYNYISRIDVREFDRKKIPSSFELVEREHIELIKWRNDRKPKFSNYASAATYGYLKLLKVMVKIVDDVNFKLIIGCALSKCQMHVLKWVEDIGQVTLNEYHFIDARHSIETIQWVLKWRPITIVSVQYCFDQPEVGLWVLRNNPQFTYAALGVMDGGIVIKNWYIHCGNIDEIMAFVGDGFIDINMIYNDKTIPLMNMIENPDMTQESIDNALVTKNYKVVEWARNLGRPSVDALWGAIYNEDYEVIDYIDTNFNELIQPVYYTHRDSETEFSIYVNECYARKIARI